MLDIIIHYTKGEEIALLTPRTLRGRFFLSDNVKGKRINNSTMTKSLGQLLDLIGKMNDAGLVARWDG